ncbi:SpoIIE family protein phosphatase [Isoptericola sp. S6320L]|uniref:SpoIIE family protein phosphatase n=1 Tax=Isoptericola sp. S6320L TaxID=2926411 RepID=UPI001FF25FF5|nr:SpoIIE family protein phosphatase [Isoptericola sp. S6320L]MCK0115805.1 SpoIIE family protein phosphatase [Isoptericola sp. S6320L]
MSDWFEAAVPNSGCGAVARATDWASTALGDPSGWPAGLRSAVELCFSTRFAVLVTWGPDLTMIYNDGYRAMLGSDLHPRAMGSPAATLWGQIWDDIGPLFTEVLTSGEPTWNVDMLLWMNRSGFLEETRFTFSYSPLRDDDGTVRGVMDIATETTDQVVNQRRLGTLGLLSTALHGRRGDLREVAEAAMDVLTASEDVGYAHLYLGPDRVASTGGDDAAHADDVATARRGGAVSWRDGTLVVPLGTRRGRSPLGALVLGGNRRRPLDDVQRSFLELLARTTGTALAEAEEHRDEITRARTVSDALQAAMVPAPPRSPLWCTRYRPADDSLSVGGDWFDVVSGPDATSGLVVGDCVGHGVEAAARMGRLSSAGRAVMLDGAGPARTLEMLDVFARTVPGSEWATVFCGVVDPVARTLVYSSAGHPPALVVGADGGTRWLDRARGTPLAVTTERRPEHTEPLAAGDTVLLYTDGLVERRGEVLTAGLERLARAAATACANATLDEVPDRLLSDVLPGAARDDVAIVLYRVP